VVLGIWEGHDAGAALVAGEEILFAVNEERLTRRKLEVGFPRLSIDACLQGAGVAPGEVAVVAASTTDPAKTLTLTLPKGDSAVLRVKSVTPRAEPWAAKALALTLPANAEFISLERHAAPAQVREIITGGGDDERRESGPAAGR